MNTPELNENCVSQPLSYKCRKRATISFSWGRIQELKMFHSAWGLIQWTTLSAAFSLSKHELWCEVRLRTHPASMWNAKYNHKSPSMSSCVSYYLPSPLSSRRVKVQGDGSLNNVHPNSCGTGCLPQNSTMAYLVLRWSLRKLPVATVSLSWLFNEYFLPQGSSSRLGMPISYSTYSTKNNGIPLASLECLCWQLEVPWRSWQCLYFVTILDLVSISKCHGPIILSRT